MVGARGVSADAEAPYDFSILVIQGQSSSENDHSSNGLSDERVIGLTKLLRVTGESGIRIGAAHDTVKRVAGLGGCINVAGRKSEIICAECICSIRFLRGYETTSRPLRATIGSGEHDRTNN